MKLGVATLSALADSIEQRLGGRGLVSHDEDASHGQILCLGQS